MGRRFPQLRTQLQHICMAIFPPRLVHGYWASAYSRAPVFYGASQSASTLRETDKGPGNPGSCSRKSVRINLIRAFANAMTSRVGQRDTQDGGLACDTNYGESLERTVFRVQLNEPLLAKGTPRVSLTRTSPNSSRRFCYDQAAVSGKLVACPHSQGTLGSLLLIPGRLFKHRQAIDSLTNGRFYENGN